MCNASPKITCALAQALERKKSELRASEAIILKLKEENQLLTSQVNREKIVVEKTKHDIHVKLVAVSNTLQLAIEQLTEAVDACTSGELRKLSDALARTGNCALVPALLATSEIEQLPSLVPANKTEHHITGPSRILASNSEVTEVYQNYGDDDFDDDESQAVSNGSKLVQIIPPPDGFGPASNLSVIVEQSYLIPSDNKLSGLEPEHIARHSNYLDRRRQTVFQPSSVDSPVAEKESSRNLQSTSRRSRSRSRPLSGLESDRMSSGVANRADSFIVDKPKKASCCQRHESTSGIDKKMAEEEYGDHQIELLDDKLTDGSKSKKIVRGKEKDSGTDSARTAKTRGDEDLEVENGHIQRRHKELLPLQDEEQCVFAEATLPEDKQMAKQNRPSPIPQTELVTAGKNSNEDMAIERRLRKRRAARSTNLFEDDDGASLHSPKAKLLAIVEREPSVSEVQPLIEETVKSRLESGSSAELASGINHKAATAPTSSAKALSHNSCQLPKNARAGTPKGENRVKNVTGPDSKCEKSGKATSAQKERTLLEDSKKLSLAKDLTVAALTKRADPSKSDQPQTSQPTSELKNDERSTRASTEANINPKNANDAKSKEEKSSKQSARQSRHSVISNASSEGSPHQETMNRRSRRRATHAVSYREPMIKTTLRPGDPFTSSIYDDFNDGPLKHVGHEKPGVKKPRKVLSTVTNNIPAEME